MAPLVSKVCSRTKVGTKTSSTTFFVNKLTILDRHNKALIRTACAATETQAAFLL